MDHVGADEISLTRQNIQHIQHNIPVLHYFMVYEMKMKLTDQITWDCIVPKPPSLDRVFSKK